jgi:riboflavin kinase/FMN adenylyltransferase
VASLRAAGEALGFDVDAKRLLESAQGPVSSSFIRRCIADGDVATANRLLGRPHELAARVTESARERTGYDLSVADVEADPSMAIPGQGLYAAWTVTRDDTVPTVCDIAARHPHSGSTVSIRSHSLNPADELPPGDVRIRFAGRLGDRRQAGGRDGGPGRIELGAARAAHRLLDRTDPRTGDF